MISHSVKQLGWSIATTALLVVPGNPLMAQQGATELGMDAGLTYHVGKGSGDNVLQVTLPFSGFAFPAAHNAFRVGFFATDRVSIEPSTNFYLYHYQGESSVWWLGLATDVQYHIVADRARARPFIGVGVNGNFAGGGSDTQSQYGVSAQFGVKFPVRNRLGVRLAAGAARFFQNGNADSETAIFGTLGFSFYTK